MSFEIIKDQLISQTPSLQDDLTWDHQNALLVINFTNNNKRDVHPDHHSRLNGPSHQTHIDLTSGKDIEVGFSPVIDFFPGVNQPKPRESEKITYKAKIHTRNIQDIGGVDYNGIWLDDLITFKRLHNVNNSRNPKAQLTEKENINRLRAHLGYGTSLVFLRGDDGIYTALGLQTEPVIVEAMKINNKSKRKRMFLPVESLISDLSEAQHITPVQIIETPSPTEIIDDNRKRIQERERSTQTKNRAQSVHRPNDGYIYAVTNRGFPGWVKVGRTTRDYTSRLSDYQTYAPSELKFEMKIHEYVKDCIIIERRVLNALAAMDHNRDREWFKVPLETVEKIIKICKENL